MNKQVLAALAVVAASSSAVAFEGMYGGAALSYDFGKVNDLLGDPSVAKVKAKGFGLDLFGGYNYMVSDQALVGAEAFVGYSTLKKKFGTNDAAKIKAPLHAGVAARLGFVVSDEVLVFAKVGADVRRAKLTYASASVSETRLGWLAGAGVEYKLNDSMAVRGDYTYTSTKFKKLAPTKEKLNLHRVSLGVSYSF